MTPSESKKVAMGIKEMSSGREETVSYNGRNVDLLSAIRSPHLTNALIEIGWCSLDLGSPGMIRIKDVSRNPALMAHIFDYAVEVSPRLGHDDNALEMERVVAHAEFLKERSGAPEVPAELVKEVGVLAQMEINRREANSTPGPGDREAE